MKKFIFCLIILFTPFIFVKANNISSINMDIFIDNNGDASVIETWDATVNSGTEGYHPYFNIGNSKIIMESASMDGKLYSIDNYWDINRSLEDKAYKAGIYESGNEVDVCYGISNYGNHEYEIKYKITNFVLSLADADMVYWTLFPYDFSATPDNVYIKIHSNFKYEDTLDVWGYGNYGGTAYVYDGYIEMNSPDRLTKDQYMTVLIKFPKGTFTTNNISNNEFEYYHNMAEVGTTRYQESNKNNIFDTIALFASILISILPIIIVLIIALTSKSLKEEYDFGDTGNTIRKDVPNFRDIPCNKDIFRAYFVAKKYKIMPKKENLLGALLLKWLKDGNIRVEKIEKKTLFGKKIRDNIIFVNIPNGIQLEKDMYNWMVEASKDGKLEENEFKKWCNNRYNKILTWFDDIINYEKDELIKEGKIQFSENKKRFSINKKYVVDSSMMIEAEQMQGLKNYLKEFTLIKEKEPIEVNLWNEYLIYAQIFGIAKEVAQQFKKLYPEINEYMNQYGYSYESMYFIYTVSNTGIKSANTAQSRASSYSSGGGGFSSGGGGGGSFGGGGGGGGFR